MAFVFDEGKSRSLEWASGFFVWHDWERNLVIPISAGGLVRDFFCAAMEFGAG
jgi:hypothetical protein